MTPERKKRSWTPEQRAEQARRLRERKIWLKSTGPKTPDGKAASSQNALKHGGYSAAEKRERRQILAFLHYNKRLVEVWSFFLKQGINPQKQEELDNFFRTNELRALFHAKFPPFPPHRLRRAPAAKTKEPAPPMGPPPIRVHPCLSVVKPESPPKTLLFGTDFPILPAMNSLGFAKDPKETRVVVAMSGGVDSSVAAALLHEQGYDVIGITLQLYDYGDAIAKKGACCAGKDIYDAKRVAEERGFPHYVLNYESNFKQSVIDGFVDSYLKGETPIPCVTCNQTVKFKDLLQVARDLNADCMVTGHYVQRIVNTDGVAELHRATDLGKDQSYFLFATTQDQLDFLRFPLGGWSKDITRQHAERLGLVNADKPDSQDICFVPNGDYAAVVTKIAPQAKQEGQIVHLDGRILGAHDGIIHYTVGQRKGLGIGGGVTENNEPLYVVGLDAAAAKVIVGPKEALARDIVHLKNFNWLVAPPSAPIEIEVKLRSMTRAMPATLAHNGDGSATITLAAPQYGVSPGQAAVCYTGTRVIGGGWITGTALSSLPEQAAA